MDALEGIRFGGSASDPAPPATEPDAWAFAALLDAGRAAGPFDSIVRVAPDALGRVEEVGDNTSFHSAVVNKIATDARAAGAAVVTEVPLRPVNGGPGPRVDLVMQLPGQPLTFMDVKTGERPRNTPLQEVWYQTIPVGGHLTSDDPRIRQFGLTPGEPFPPSQFEYWVQKDASSDPLVGIWRPKLTAPNSDVP